VRFTEIISPVQYLWRVDREVRVRHLCAGYLNKGRTLCVRRPIPKEEVKALVWQRVASRPGAYIGAGGEQLLAKMIAD
jgi:hypothetical protein